MQRSTPACRHCDRSYEGRGIFADHGLAQLNLARHESVCLRQTERRTAVDARRQLRHAQRYRKHLEASAKRYGGVAPTIGQLGFPDFEGVPSVVV